MLTIDDNGCVIEYDLQGTPPDDVGNYADIVRLDIEEHTTWCEAVGHPEWATQDLDILEIGFWTHDGNYESASEDFRLTIIENVAEEVARELTSSTGTVG